MSILVGPGDHQYSRDFWLCLHPFMAGSRGKVAAWDQGILCLYILPVVQADHFFGPVTFALDFRS